MEQHVAVLDPHDGSIKLDRNINADLNGDMNGLRQRASLLLSNGILYVAFAAHVEDGVIFRNDPRFIYRGQILALDANTLNTLGRFQTVPNDKFGGGIWMASSGLAADENGNIYFTTGNLISLCQAGGDCTIPTSMALSPGCQGKDPHQCVSVADAAVRLAPVVTRDSAGNPLSVSFTKQGLNAAGVSDFFMPYRASWHSLGDFDLGSAGVLLVPDTHGMVFGGKGGDPLCRQS